MIYKNIDIKMITYRVICEKTNKITKKFTKSV